MSQISAHDQHFLRRVRRSQFWYFVFGSVFCVMGLAYTWWGIAVQIKSDAHAGFVQPAFDHLEAWIKIDGGVGAPYRLSPQTVAKLGTGMERVLAHEIEIQRNAGSILFALALRAYIGMVGFCLGAMLLEAMFIQRRFLRILQDGTLPTENSLSVVRGNA